MMHYNFVQDKLKMGKLKTRHFVEFASAMSGVNTFARPSADTPSLGDPIMLHKDVKREEFEHFNIINKQIRTFLRTLCINLYNYLTFNVYPIRYLSKCIKMRQNLTCF